MKKMILAAVTVAALCVPAVAQQSGQTPAQPGSASSQGRNAPGGQNNIASDELSASQVQQIQQSLDNKGFKSGKVDGKWGPQTEAALRDFQKSQNMSSAGNVDGPTIAGLGLNSSDFGLSGTGSETTGQAPSGGSNAHQNQNAPQHNDSGNNQNSK